MAWFKRISLFLLVNFLIMITISLIINILGLQTFLTRKGIDYHSLLIFCLLWGMGGAFISLLLSKKMAKWIVGVHAIDSHTNDPRIIKLLEIVESQAKKLKLPMPEVGIFESRVPNAFATGPTKSHSLVAISRGLLDQLNPGELEAVIGHEMTHIANGDMVTMTLLQGIINAFVMFLARILAFFFASSKDRDNSSMSFGSYYLFTFIFEIVFMLLGSLVLCAFSRFREYRADKGGAILAGKSNMIAALRALDKATVSISHQKLEREGAPASVQALMIHPSKGSLLTQLFSTHPSIEKRIERLNQ
jgi:heat shock protein HtpX